MSEQQFLLAPVDAVLELELVDGTIADELADAVVIAAPAPSGSVSTLPTATELLTTGRCSIRPAEARARTLE